MKLSRAIVVAAASLSGLVAAVAFGQSSEAARRAEAERLLASLASSTDAPAIAPSVSASVARAKLAFETADKARAAHNELHAQIAEGAGADWAGTAKALDLGDRAIASATTDEAVAASASASASVAAARLDESIARRSKLRAALDTLEAEAAARPLSSASVAPKTKGHAR